MSCVIIFLIKIYQKNISIFLPPVCRFTPSCSEYTKLAVMKYGAVTGTWKGIKRIFKCNPFFAGGMDNLE
ncbi:MAG: membrane protein insertion efficiency factor YidD [Candidatus Schekmanbacteria bacterium RBG_13_48_7]|uniref:Putative membrane protein insertion efficiency factor n=1 Tax=Candidatus Schekmanbacteria bacterium RBG_13_48_7 TaxID=1817878 RepID=A0A1F7RQC0_9BACT|nr:MAG: membrane protein insertion efficiency factor YidD [Candidatus Schekmanbacteria bacterium RBG_13_48_7]